MTTTVIQIPLEQLRVASSNTRKDTEAGQEDSSVSGLAQSIREHGLLNPITVKRDRSGAYAIVAGQRRFLACKALGMDTISAIVRENVTETGAVALSLIENVQRADMHPLDKAEAYRELRDQYKGNLRAVSEATGVTIATIQRYLQLLQLPSELRDELGTGKGAAGVGAMAQIAKTFDKPDDMVDAFNQVGGFSQDIQAEILKRSGGDVNLLPELVMQASEGAFDIKRCGSSALDCPHVPDELREPLLQAIEGLRDRRLDAAEPLKEFAARHKKKRS
ncbi:MAG TPA: ParB/RepB/Spo0J family partition protein [Gemmatimonadaceae bacterium]|nr:ParB/RepB/Spo0J family partition protein [Gemmatimonadaceae bacterium]